MLKIVYRFILQMARSVLQFQLMQRLRKLGLDVSPTIEVQRYNTTHGISLYFKVLHYYYINRKHRKHRDFFSWKIVIKLSNGMRK